MFPILLLSLLIGVGANSYECPTNVTCVENETCCQTTSGLWSCCPIEDAVCCNDGLHCCSKGEKCLTNGSCSSSTNQIYFAFPLRFEQNQLKSVPCPDGSACDDGETCCELSSGQYACCPHPDAVCCSDHIHCCPKDHTCDVERGHCKRKIDELNNIPCPDGSSVCPDGYTCCLLESGNYGCCPSVDAVCCSDHLHCCPHGQVCDVAHGQCISEISVPWLTKKPAFHRTQKLTSIINEKETKISELNISSKELTDVICPDATTLCPSKSTCCDGGSEIWNCCPLDQAVCCSDHKHCCPTHYKCDLHLFTCNHDLFGSIPMIKKELPLHKISSKLIDSSNSFSSLSVVQCPDGNLCPEETTCCQLKDNTYGCCPYPEGSCCSDKIHCCGSGYSCDESGNRCIRHFNELNKTDIIPSRFKLKSLKKENKIANLIKYFPKEDQLCPDEKTKCSLNSTCCPNKNGNEISYSCCPYSKGVCCGSNGSVCCPNDYDCNEQQLSCELRDSNILKEILSTTNYNQCESSDVTCPDGQTCCRTYGTELDFACCPYSDGQCCSDGTGCCPNGTICDSLTGGCY